MNPTLKTRLSDWTELNWTLKGKGLVWKFPPPPLPVRDFDPTLLCLGNNSHPTAGDKAPAHLTNKHVTGILDAEETKDTSTQGAPKESRGPQLLWDGTGQEGQAAPWVTRSLFASCGIQCLPGATADDRKMKGPTGLILFLSQHNPALTSSSFWSPSQGPLESLCSPAYGGTV